MQEHLRSSWQLKSMATGSDFHLAILCMLWASAQAAGTGAPSDLAAIVTLAVLTVFPTQIH
jgi:hypothetical protein